MTSSHDSKAVVTLAEGSVTLGRAMPVELQRHGATVLLIEVESGAIVDANEAAARFYGWSRDELLARTIFEINTAPLDVVHRALAASAQASPEGVGEVMHFQHRRADGSLREVEVSSSPLGWQGRTLLCSIVHDVTQRRREQDRSALLSDGLKSVLSAADELLDLDLDDLLKRAVEMSRERLGLERCAIFLVDREAQRMRGTFSLRPDGHARDQRGNSHGQMETWLGDATPTEPGQRWVVTQGELREWNGSGSGSSGLGIEGWTAITLIRSSQGVVGTFHNDCAWSGAPLDVTQQELVDVFCSLLGSMIERKKVEAALRQSEREFRVLAENATDLIGRAERDGTILYLSPSCLTVLGHEPEELVGRSVFDLVHPEDARKFKWLRQSGPGGADHATDATEDKRGSRVRRGESSRQEMRARDQKGQWMWIEVVSRPILGAGGRLAEVQFSARDISMRKRAEEALRESEERFRLFMDNTPAMTFIKDAVGRYVYLNQTAQRLYDAPMDKMRGLSNFDRLPLEVARQLRDNDAQVLASGEPGEFLEIIPGPDGRQRSWLTFKFPLYGADGSVSLGGVALDISERREFEAALLKSQQHLSTVINSASLVLWTLDSEGVFTTSEGQGLRALGMRPGEVVGQSALEVYADHPEIAKMIRSVLDGEEFEGDLPLGEMILQISHKPLRDLGGHITGTLGVAFDITHRRRAEEALARAVGRLENLLEIDRAIRAAVSPGEIADVALSRLCAQLNCHHAAVTVFNFEANEATVLALRDESPETPHKPQEQPQVLAQVLGGDVEEELEQAEQVELAGIHLLRAGQSYPLEAIMAMLSPLVARDLEALPVSRAGDRAPFWQRHGSVESSAEGGKKGDPANARRRSLPLIAGGELVGALDLESADGPMAEEKWTVAREVAGQLAIAIQQARLFEQVRAGRAQLQALSHRLIEAQEAERRHLARELHDEIGQVLTAVKLNLQGVSKLTERWIERAAASASAMPPSTSGASSTWDDRAPQELGAADAMIAEASGLRVRLSESMEIVEHALGQVRDLSLNLRPSLLDDLGLGAAMRWFVDRLASRLPVEVKLQIALEEERVPTEIETACFRVAQEALTNATRHAQASRIEISLEQTDGWLDLVIHDDGQGFDVREARERAAAGSSLGLPGMEERAVLAGGRLSVESTPGQGTTLHAVFPLHCAWPRVQKTF